MEKLINNYEEAIECLEKNKPTSGYYMVQESIDMAIEAIQLRIKKKPKRLIAKLLIDRGWKWKCPCCDHIVGANKYDLSYGFTDYYDYCQNCGQRLDWSVRFND